MGTSLPGSTATKQIQVGRVALDLFRSALLSGVTRNSSGATVFPASSSGDGSVFLTDEELDFVADLVAEAIQPSLLQKSPKAARSALTLTGGSLTGQAGFFFKALSTKLSSVAAKSPFGSAKVDDTAPARQPFALPEIETCVSILVARRCGASSQCFDSLAELAEQIGFPKHGTDDEFWREFLDLNVLSKLIYAHCLEFRIERP